jgi:hypothetical protein
MSHEPTPHRHSSQCKQCDKLELRVKALESQLTKLQVQLAKAQEGKTGGPEENADYFRKKPTAEEAHRLEIGKILRQVWIISQNITEKRIKKRIERDSD